MNTTESIKAALASIDAHLSEVGWTENSNAAIEHLNAALSALSASAEQQPEWISAELVSYAGSTHPNPDMICRNLATNQMFLCDPWVGCALPHEVRPELGTLINFREGPWRENVYLPHVAQIVGKVAPSAPQASQPSAWNEAIDAAANVCRSEYELRETAGKSHPEDSPERDRCFAAARAANNCMTAIRALAQQEQQFGTIAHQRIQGMSPIGDVFAQSQEQQAPAVQEGSEAKPFDVVEFLRGDFLTELGIRAFLNGDSIEFSAEQLEKLVLAARSTALASHPAPAQTAPIAANSDAGWLPIDTAPKDGSPILLGRAEDECNTAESTVGWWQEAVEDGVDYMGGDAGFVDFAFQVFNPGRSFGMEKYRHAADQPTHWKPLPPAPLAATAQQKGGE